MDAWVLVVHLVAVAFLFGVGWLTQLALYPLFGKVDEASWLGYHAAHESALARTVAVPWVVQGVTTVALLVRPPPGVGTWLVWLDAALAALPVLLTAVRAVPLHRRLAERPDPALFRSLLQVNLLRTAVWTAGTGTAVTLVLLSR